MSSPEFESTAGGDNELPYLPLGLSVPDTADELLYEIDVRQGDKAAVEVVNMALHLQDRLRGLDNDFGSEHRTRTAYFSQPVDGGDRQALVTSRNYQKIGDVWHIIVNDRFHTSETVHLAYHEYAVTKDMLCFNYQSGFMYAKFPGLWDAASLGDCSLLRRQDDRFLIYRGNRSRLVLPDVNALPTDRNGLLNHHQSMVGLNDILGTLNYVTHDSEVIRGKLR